MYYGELCQIHGKEEADAFIKKGKWVRTKDSDDDECFVKRVRTEEHELKQEKSGQCSRQCDTDDAGFDKIAQAMGIHFSKNGFCTLRDAGEMSGSADED